MAWPSCLGACGMAALTACALAVDGTPAGAVPAPAGVGCRQHVEPSNPGFRPARDIVRGPFGLVTVRADLPRLARASYRTRRGRLPQVKAPVGLLAGHRATLRVAAAQRARVGLVYRERTLQATRVSDADPAVTFTACRADTPGFSGGVVGPMTGWAGALIVDGPRCVRLLVLVDGRRERDIRLPLGRPCG